MNNDTAYVSQINFDDNFEKIQKLLCKDTLTIQWSSSGPLPSENGGYTRYRLESKGRPICFFETTSLGFDQVRVFRMYIISESKNKDWDNRLEKDPEFFGASRYYSNGVSSCLDGVHFEAMDHRYLAYEIAGNRISENQKEKLKHFFTNFFTEFSNVATHEIGHLRGWFQSHL